MCLFTAIWFLKEFYFVWVKEMVSYNKLVRDKIPEIIEGH